MAEDILWIENNCRFNILWYEKCIYSINKNYYYWKERECGFFRVRLLLEKQAKKQEKVVFF